jgi:hypothetical protein
VLVRSGVEERLAADEALVLHDATVEPRPDNRP